MAHSVIPNWCSIECPTGGGCPLVIIFTHFSLYAFLQIQYEVENNFLKSTYRVAADFAEIGKDDKSSLPICCTLCYTLEKSKKFGELQKYERGDVCPIGLKNWSIWTIFISFKTINQLIVFHALTALGTKNNVHSVSTDLLITSYLWHWIKRMH